MRHLPRQPVLWTLLLLVGLFGPAVFPDEGEEAWFTGAWIGFTETYASFFRLELTPDGKGLLANATRARGDAAVYLYRVDRWSMQGSKIRLKLTPLNAETPAIQVKGKTATNEIHLEVSRGGRSTPKILRLYRETAVEEQLEQLREKMTAAGED